MKSGEKCRSNLPSTFSSMPRLKFSPTLNKLNKMTSLICRMGGEKKRGKGRDRKKEKFSLKVCMKSIRKSGVNMDIESEIDLISIPSKTKL